ncbi:MAG: fluoride efflux transporter CrcB [Deltaproteobacteria bacterium]|nr:fluoride efflux transporter CrcB [Deltaproteobacteria bacterium]
MINVIYVAIGGAIGSVFRYVFSGGVHVWINSTYPWGTFAVNLTGSFIAGFLWRFFEEMLIPAHMRPFIFIGILGGFTTFSSYMLETLNMLRDGEFLAACGNLVLHNLCGIIVISAGFMLAQLLVACFK